MWCSKAPILLLYIAIFGIRVMLRISSYIVLVLLGIATLVAAAGTSAACDPRGGGITAEFILQCHQMGSKYGVALGFVSVFVDVIIIILPIPAVWQLNLPKHKKVGLSIMFMSGILYVQCFVFATWDSWSLTVRQCHCRQCCCPRLQMEIDRRYKHKPNERNHMHVSQRSLLIQHQDEAFGKSV